MDRCQCDKYRDAVKNHKHYGVGLFKYDVLENQDRRGFEIKWRRNDISHADMKFEKPQALFLGEKQEVLKKQYSKEGWKQHQQWCSLMTPVDNKKDSTKYQTYYEDTNIKDHHKLLQTEFTFRKNLNVPGIQT